MSEIFGVFFRNGKPANPLDLERQMTILNINEPVAKNCWCRGSVSLANLMIDVTTETMHAPQTITRTSARNVFITASVRLDNREELFETFRIPREEQDSFPDSQLLIFSYMKWGEACPDHLLGDFAFVIWDEDQQVLFCARDHLGIRPFYYYLSSEIFVFSSSVLGVLAHPDIPCKIDKLALAMHLRDISFTSKTMTFCTDVKKLPPAHSLTLDITDARKQRYWDPAESPPVRLPSLDDYAEKFRELFHLAVSCRLRSTYPVGAHLSGGLDSSAIAVVAARELRSRGQSLPTFNWIPPLRGNDDRDALEYLYSRLICEQEGLVNQNIDLTVDDIIDELNADLCLGQGNTFWYEPKVCKAAARQGVRVLLSGWGGDELISFNGRGYYSGLFWGGQWVKLARALYLRGSRGSSRNLLKISKGLLSGLYHKVFLPSLPDQLYAHFDRKWLAPFIIDCTTREFKNYIKLHPKKPSNTLRERVGSRANQIALLEYGHLSQRIETWANYGRDHKIIYAYPLLDKRIVEFSLGIPADMYARHDYGRYLFRYAMKGILPDEVRWGGLKREPIRADRMIDMVLQASQQWLSQADQQGLLNEQNPYIDTQALLNLKPKNSSEWDRLIYAETLSKSIQILGVGKRVYDLLKNGKFRK